MVLSCLWKVLQLFAWRFLVNFRISHECGSKKVWILDKNKFTTLFYLSSWKLYSGYGGEKVVFTRTNFTIEIPGQNNFAPPPPKKGEFKTKLIFISQNVYVINQCTFKKRKDGYSLCICLVYVLHIKVKICKVSLIKQPKWLQVFFPFCPIVWPQIWCK